MSQVFQADGVFSSAGTVLTTGTFVAVATGNFVNPPFGNCKAIVRGICAALLGNAPTAVNARIVRNPNGENVVVGIAIGITNGVGAAANISLALTVMDAVPDGRPCQYQLQVQQAGGSNGTNTLSSIEVQLISG